MIQCMLENPPQKSNDPYKIGVIGLTIIVSFYSPNMCLVDNNDTMDDYPKMHPRMHFEDWVKCDSDFCSISQIKQWTAASGSVYIPLLTHLLFRMIVNQH